MEQPIIDFENAFESTKMDKSKPRRSGYLRVIEYLDNKEHSLPLFCESDCPYRSANWHDSIKGRSYAYDECRL